MKKKDAKTKHWKRKDVRFTYSTEPNGLIDLINEYFPQDLAKKWANLRAIEKWVISSKTWPEGTDVRYKDRSAVLEAALKIHTKNPHLRVKQIAEHPEIEKAVGGTHYTQETLEDWIRELKLFSPGRPKSKNHTN